MSDFAKEILKEFGDPVVTMTEGELNDKLKAAANGGEEGNNGGDPGDEGAQAGATGGTENAGAKTDEGERKEGEAGQSKEDVNAGSKPAPVAKKEDAQASTPPTEPEDVDDEKLFAALKKKFPDLKSLDDLKPQQKEPSEEEKAEAQKELASKAIQHGLKNKLFTPAQLEEYTLAKSRDPRDLALEAFGNFLRKGEPELSDEDVEDRFSTYYGENLADDHWMKPIKDREMKDLANAYLNGKYGAITNATNDYSETVRVEQEARNYKSEVEKVFSAPTEMTLKVKGKEYKFQPGAETINAIKDQFLSSEQLGTFGNKAPDPALLAQSIKAAFIVKDFDRILDSVSQSHAAAVLADKMAGRKGVIPTRSAESDQKGEQGVYNGRALDVIEETLGKQA